MKAHLKSLEIYKAISYEKHHDIGNSYYYLGLVNCNLGEYDQAIEFHMKAIEVRESAFGRKHVDIAISYNGLGTVYEKMGEYSKALECYLKSVEVYQLLNKERYNKVMSELKGKIDKLKDEPKID